MLAGEAPGGDTPTPSRVDVSSSYARRSRPHTLQHLQSRLSSGGVILSPVVARPSVSALSRTMTAPTLTIAAIRSGFPVVVGHIAGLPTPLVGFVSPCGPSGRRLAGGPVAVPLDRDPIADRTIPRHMLCVITICSNQIDDYQHKVQASKLWETLSWGP
jgi:hypothetical protein